MLAAPVRHGDTRVCAQSCCTDLRLQAVCFFGLEKARKHPHSHRLLLLSLTEGAAQSGPCLPASGHRSLPPPSPHGAAYGWSIHASPFLAGERDGPSNFSSPSYFLPGATPPPVPPAWAVCTLSLASWHQEPRQSPESTSIRGSEWEQRVFMSLCLN